MVGHLFHISHVAHVSLKPVVDRVHITDESIFLGCYNYVAKNANFPCGDHEILIGNQLDDIEFDGSAFKFISTNRKLIGGFIKALILSSKDKDPFFQVKYKGKNYDGCCQKCVETKTLECTHEDRERAFEVTTTIQAMAFALKIGNCEIYKKLEIWNFKQEGKILEDYVSSMLIFGQHQEIQVKKWLNNAMQISFGKLSQKPTLEKSSLVKGFDEIARIYEANETITNLCK